jgi:hypothetical protein
MIDAALFAEQRFIGFEFASRPDDAGDWVRGPAG